MFCFVNVFLSVLPFGVINDNNNKVVGFWHGYLSGARCIFACGADGTTAIHCLLLQ